MCGAFTIPEKWPERLGWPSWLQPFPSDIELTVCGYYADSRTWGLGMEFEFPQWKSQTFSLNRLTIEARRHNNSYDLGFFADATIQIKPINKT